MPMITFAAFLEFLLASTFASPFPSWLTSAFVSGSFFFPSCPFFSSFFPLSPLGLRKYRIASASRIPAKIRNVMEVPTAGIVTKVGTKVPMMLPLVLNAFSMPTVFPLSPRSSTVNFTSDGVTVPRRNSGNTKTTMQAANAAQIRNM